MITVSMHRIGSSRYLHLEPEGPVNFVVSVHDEEELSVDVRPIHDGDHTAFTRLLRGEARQFSLQRDIRSGKITLLSGASLMCLTSAEAAGLLDIWHGVREVGETDEPLARPAEIEDTADAVA